MKLNFFILFAFLLILTGISTCSHDEGLFKEYDPLLVVVIMVKDEAPVMRATLKPFVDAGITSFFIFDTGSRDNTVEVTIQFFKDCNITSYYIEQEPFIDFANSRNRALDLAEARFPRACFMLMPDAEWYQVNGKKLLEFCEKEKNNSHASYMIRIIHPNMDFYTQRLLRVSEHCRFAGAVHESITKVTFEKVPSEIFFDLRVSSKGAKKTANRWLRDKELLLRDYLETPENPRTCFYLAQTFECLGDLENAALYYRKRTGLAGWAEENFMTWYRLGGVIEQLERDKTDGWNHALECYLRAYSMRSHRIEPLVKITQHYVSEGNSAIAFLFAYRACQVPYPEGDVLFVEKAVYEYLRFDLLGQCSWYIKEYEIGEKAIRDAMKIQPDLPHLLRNLAFYLDRKVQQRIQQNAVAEAA